MSGKRQRATPRRRLVFEPLECRALLTAAPIPTVPTAAMMPADASTSNVVTPPLAPTVITAGGQRLLLSYFNDGPDPTEPVTVSFDFTTDKLVCNHPGWWVENYPLDQIGGLENLTEDQAAQLLFGVASAADVKNWYVMTPVDATHPAPPEPAAPTGPAPIVKSDLTDCHVLVVDNNATIAATYPGASDPWIQSYPGLAAAKAAGNVDASTYSTLPAALSSLSSDAAQYYTSATNTVAMETVVLVTPGRPGLGLT